MFAHLGYALIMATFLNQSMFHLLDKPVGYALKKGAIPGWLFKNQRKKVDDKHYEVREISKRLAIFLSLALPILFHGIWNILLVLGSDFCSPDSSLFQFHHGVRYVSVSSTWEFFSS